MLTPLKRIFRSSWLSFKRNSALSLATVFIVVLTIFVITFLFLFQGATRFLVSGLQEKVDISVYFKEDSPEEEIIKAQDEISEIPEVKNVEYVSRRQALETFVQKHKDDPLLMESLKEVGANPFLASLNIKAGEAEQYEQLANFLENSSFKDIIQKVDYYQRRPVIERLFSITSTINKTGVVITTVLVLISFLVAFNTIRLAIYNSREEIKIQRLVGASNWFIRGPFLAQGLISGLLATVVTVLLFLLICWFSAPKIEILFPGFNMFSFFLGNFWLLLGIQLLAGIGIGIISSLIAIRRYLKI